MRLPKVVVHLHPKPRLRRVIQPFTKPYGHVRRDAGSPVENAGERSSRYAELPRRFSHRNSRPVENSVPKNFAGMRRVKHTSHSRLLLMVVLVIHEDRILAVE